LTADFVMAEPAIATAQPEETLLEFAVREHARLVYRIAHSVLRNPAEAEDAVQDTFLRVLRYGGKASRIQDQKAWLARIAWRVAVDRRAKLAHSAGQSDGAIDSLLSPAEGAERVLLEKERREVLDRLIASLPEKLRDPLVLGTVEELSPREVGEMLGISEAAVRSRAFRARQILQDRMKGWIGDRQ
jgi:RNA polymerase sigma-70 factor, ECF subfamily